MIAPGRIAIDHLGRLWVSEPDRDRIRGVDEHGQPLAELPSLPGAHGIALAVDASAVYAAAPDRGTIYRLALGQTPGSPAILTDALDQPWAIAADEEAGALYACAAGSGEIWHIATRGSTSARVLTGTPGAAPGDGPLDRAAFGAPTGLVLSPDRRRLYVVDSRPLAVRVIDLLDGAVTTLAGPPSFAPARRRARGGPDARTPARRRGAPGPPARPP
ncbi:MAG: hypothetical protein AAGC55_15810, partial [Myxococcota bacterium]